jgi:hypothetical protein
MKPITECSREERLERALMAIECLTYLFDSHDKDGKQLAHDVYCIAHAAPGRCGNPHEDWVKKIEEIEETGKSFNIYKVENHLVAASYGEGWDA